jgi:hypothetical protein
MSSLSDITSIIHIIFVSVTVGIQTVCCVNIDAYLHTTTNKVRWFNNKRCWLDEHMLNLFSTKAQIKKLKKHTTFKLTLLSLVNTKLTQFVITLVAYCYFIVSRRC